MPNLKEQIQADLIQAIQNLFDLNNLNPFIRENQVLPRFDYQIDIAFVLAKILKKNPIEVADHIVQALKRTDIYEEIHVSKPGFINLKINNLFLETYLNQLIDDKLLGVNLAQKPQIIVVDYASPNVAKEMHVGHLRSAIIGDSIVRILLFLGHNVIKQNHIGDWGTPFGFLIQYIIENNLTLENINEVNNAYKEARKLFDNDNDFAIKAKKRLVLLQSHDEYTYSIWKILNKLSHKHFNEVFEKLGLFLKEEDARGESYYNSMLPNMVKELMDKGIAEDSDGAKVIFLPGFYDENNKPVPIILQKSDGGYLYHTTDLAAARYRINKLKANRIIYVTDARQKQHFKMLFAALHKIGWAHDNSVSLNHIPFGNILGDDKKPFKTRSGDTISLISLLNEAEIRAKELIETKCIDINEQELKEIGNAIGIGSIKYSDLSNDLAKDYIFSWDKMLSFNGNSSPYLQNAYVRIKSIFRKERINLDSIKDNKIILTNEDEKKLCLKATEFPEIINSVEEKLAPHLLCNYLFELASLFHNFYQIHPIGKCNNEMIKISRLLISYLVAKILHTGLDLIGIKTVEKM
jgi:arginyl-tRNA synthetase